VLLTLGYPAVAICAYANNMSARSAAASDRNEDCPNRDEVLPVKLMKVMKVRRMVPLGVSRIDRRKRGSQQRRRTGEKTLPHLVGSRHAAPES